MNAKLTDTAVYLLWAYQGVIMSDVSMDEDSLSIIIHVSVPSHSFIRDRNHKELCSLNLISRVIDVSDILKMSMKFNQGIDVKFVVEERQEEWTKEDASISLKNMMQNLFMGNPFEGVM